MEDGVTEIGPWLRQAAVRLEEVRTFGDAMDVLLESTRRLGFQGVDYSYMPVARTGSAWVAPPVAFRAFPPGWDRHWHRHSADDPYYHACFERSPWVEWAEVRSRSSLTPRERSAIAYLQATGINDGITVPIRMSGDQLAFVTGLEPPKAAPQLAADRLLALAHYFHHFLQQRRLLGDWSPAARLSPRELECLALAAHGSTATASAQRLDRSADTVRVHLRNAIRKLGARNVTQAVARAIRLDLIGS